MKISLGLLRSAQAIKPHIPLIKFRKAQQEQPISSKPPASKGTSPASGRGLYFIDEHQLPTRFRRQTLAENEILAVNSGGAL